jgi:predicted secreted protein
MTYSGSQAQAGRGSTLSIGSTPVAIGELADVPFKRGEWDNVDVTNFESGSDQELLPTIRKSVTFTLKGNRVSTDAGQAAVETAYQSGALATFKLQLLKNPAQTTTGDYYSFSAYIKASDFDVKTTDKIEFSITLQTSGAITLTEGS